MTVVLLAGMLSLWQAPPSHGNQSSAEAEYMGQSAAATNVMWTRGLLKELQIKGANLENVTLIYADNQGAISLANHPTFQKRSKHINIRYYYTRDLIKQGEIELAYRSTHDMIADGLTKQLGPIKFAQFVKGLRLQTVESARAEAAAAGEAGVTKS